jgi:hypothetical protein
MADRKISDLTALTTPASGDYLPIVDISEAAAASKNKRITIEELMRGVPDGTAAAPGIAFETDPNTGIYSPGADQLAISTGGTGRLFIDASGNVGINDAIPNSYTNFTTLSLNGTTGSEIDLQSGGTITGTLASSASYCELTSSAALRFVTAGTFERLRITSAGLVGIGTSTPVDKLTVAGATVNAAIFNTSPGTVVSPSFCKLNFYGYLADSNGNVASISAGNSQGNNYAGILQFATNAADGTHTTAVTIDGSQRVGIGTTSPSYKLHVSGSTGIIRGESTGASFLSPSLDLYDSTHAVEVILTPASGLGALGTFSNHPLAFYTNNGEKARITSDGKLLVGTSSARAIGTQSLAIQNEGISFNTTGFSTCANRNDIYGPYIHLGKSRGTSVGSSTIVQSGDILGGIVFAGADGTDVNTQSGVITCEVDGTPSANNMPGRIVLSTTAGGAAYPTERLRITSTGQVRLAGAGITFNGDTAAANELDDYEEGTFTMALFDAATGGNQSATTATLNYTKIGRLVHVYGLGAGNINTTGMTSGNILYITLPFANGVGFSGGEARLLGAVLPGTGTSTAAQIGATTNSRWYLHSYSAAGAVAAVTVGDLTSGASDVQYISIIYQAS